LRVWIVFIGFVALLLTSCGGFRGPDVSTVKGAIALQITQVQAELSQQLYQTPISLPTATINRVRIARQEPVNLDSQPAYRIQGVYDVTFKFSDHTVTQKNNPFELDMMYLSEEKTWHWVGAMP
jgi:hypothetical protein